MIKINGKTINLEQFGDMTLKFSLAGIDARSRADILDGIFATNGSDSMPTAEILWCYDSDSELFALQCIVDTLRDKEPLVQITLKMPYIPNARQDRCVSGRIFTLKTFAKIISSMNFCRVKVFDPHSDVSTALIDRVEVMEESHLQFLDVACSDIGVSNNYTQIMYPDNGAAKKYGANEHNIVGYKHRNNEGRIDSYSFTGLKENTARVIIIDDICSFGGTFVAAAKALKEKGVKEVCLIVSHCEDNILKGELFDYIDRVYTTDSICTIEYPKLTKVITWRE